MTEHHRSESVDAGQQNTGGQADMASIHVLRGLKSGTPRIENVMLFVSDALRWDYLPRSVSQRGVTLKTVAASLFTATSFPSMVTGLYPSAHGVYSFFDSLPKGIDSLLNLKGYNTSLWNENTWINCDPPESTAIHRVLRQSKRISLDTIEPPFIYLEDEKGGHCPFGWSSADREYEEWECGKFFSDYGRKDRGALVEKYRKGIERSVVEFEKRLVVLEQRDLVDSTLVIFTSDHGELLGEYGGHVGHGEIACPEVVYVPTVFIHPRLPGGVSLEHLGVLRHVDLYPTLLDILGMGTPSLANGVNMIAAEEIPRAGLCHMEVSSTRRVMGRSVTFTHREVSLWDRDGGDVFRESRFLKRLVDAVLRLVIGNGSTAHYLRGMLRTWRPLWIVRSLITMIKYYTLPHIRYGSPSFTVEGARKMMADIRQTAQMQRTEKDRIRRRVQRLRPGKRG